jgi:hypothetical protein
MYTRGNDLTLELTLAIINRPQRLARSQAFLPDLAIQQERISAYSK